MSEKIYVYAEHCNKNGRICLDEDPAESRGDDVFLWGEGTREDLIAEALSDLASKTVGGGAPHFRWTVARHVLKYLSGPIVYYDSTAGLYLPEPVEVEEDE